MKTLHRSTRVILGAAVLSLLSAYFLPLWEIQLWAPQYPEGLNMKIWLNRLTGSFDIINGINHYIGMKPIREEMFPEFRYMGVVLGALVAVGLLPVITGKRIWLQVFVVILLLGGGAGIYDFHRWGYDYGHDLDPKAAISVPGMSYDPPLIGYKNLLNFVAYSGPDTGGWVMIGAGAVAVALLAWEHRLGRKAAKPALARHLAAAAALLPVLFTLVGCRHEPLPITYGKDECAGCRMILVDRHYGSEFITGKGKVSKFDDLNCLMEFMRANANNHDPAARPVVVDFNRPGSFLAADQAVFLKHPRLRSPMGSHLAAFATRAEAENTGKDLGGGGVFLTWPEVLKEP